LSVPDGEQKKRGQRVKKRFITKARNLENTKKEILATDTHGQSQTGMKLAVLFNISRVAAELALKE
jgi:hypothetical protein